MAEQSSAELKARRDELLSERSKLAFRIDMQKALLRAAAEKQAEQAGQEIINGLRSILLRAGYDKSDVSQLSVKLHKADWTIAYEIEHLMVCGHYANIEINADKAVADSLIRKDILNNERNQIDQEILAIQKGLQGLKERAHGIS